MSCRTTSSYEIVPCWLRTMLLLWALLWVPPGHASRSSSSSSQIVVIGSINADTFLSVGARLPVPGENVVCSGEAEPETNVPGGKGCTQAVACAKLAAAAVCQQKQTAAAVAFVGQFGIKNDSEAAVAQMLRETLTSAGVDVQHCGYARDLACGRGYVFRTRSGQVSAVVSGGSNAHGWTKWEHVWERYTAEGDIGVLSAVLDPILKDCQCVMLQREVPEFVNLLVATYCRPKRITVIQDAGGEDRSISSEMLGLADYIMPNESELQRLVQSLGGEASADDTTVVDMAKVLQKHGARNVLVTQGSRGSTLVCESGEVLHQPAHTVLQVVDETGAGDCFRAGFATALLEGRSMRDCMNFASAAGACSVTKRGAVPSTPTRQQVEERLLQQTTTKSAHDDVLKIPRGDGLAIRGGGGGGDDDAQEEFPFLIGSRLNSMKDRPELWGSPLLTPKNFVERQAGISGLTCVDFNYPQHFHTWSTEEAKAALDEAGLVAGAVCLRYPSKFARGAMNHPDLALRREAIQLTKEAAKVAIDLGCNEVVVWSAYDGYDYPLQVDYDAKWQELVEAFRECCDAFPDIKWSLEYKPSDENTRFFTVPSTGAAMLLVNDIDRPNFGLTLDVGHMLMSGENPGQSIAMVGKRGKLFGVQLNDGFTRLAAEDGLMFGSVHPSMALEIMYQLRRTDFAGHFYFDTFPQRTDPIREAEYNIRRVKAFWTAAGAMDQNKLRKVVEDHDAVGALELVDEALRFHAPIRHSVTTAATK